MNKNRVGQIKTELRNMSDPERAKILMRFFKTGKGEYGEGDIFLGIKTPDLREVAKKYQDLTMSELQQLLKSKIHNYRSLALSILVQQYQKGDDKTKERIYRFYLKNTKYVNNWDLVDGSAPKIVGYYLLDHPGEKKILYKLARSSDLWEKRISILSTFAFLKNRQFSDTFKIAEILLHDPHDLIHKAVGWMLREIGKIDQKQEEIFLKKYYREMPRTMLRYSIERFEEKKRQSYLKKG